MCGVRKGINNKIGIYIYIHTFIQNGLLLIHKKELKKRMPFAATWMDPAIIIQSEVRERNANIA